MGAMAMPLLIASTGASAGLSIAGGFQAHAAGKAEAKQLAEARRTEALAGRQRAVAIQRNLRQTLSGQRAMMAARGLDLGDIGTPAAIAAATERAGRFDVLTNQVNTDSRMRALAFEASQAKERGRAGLLGGFVGALSSVSTAAMPFASGGGGFGFGGGAAPGRTFGSPALGRGQVFGNRSLFAGRMP